MASDETTVEYATTTTGSTEMSELDRSYCRSVEDFYGAPSRWQIVEIAQEFLSEFKLTATEFLHSARSLRDFQNHAKRTAILHRGATSQARITGEPIPTRVDELARLEEDLVRTVVGRLRAIDMPDLSATGSAPLVKLLWAAKPTPESRFALDAALTHCLSPCPTFPSKIEMVLTLHNEGMPSEALDALDQVLGEILASPAAAAELFNWVGDFRAVLELFVDLWRGEPLKHACPPAVILRLAGYLTGRDRPASRRGLETALHRGLLDERRLIPVGQGDMFDAKTVMEELLAVGTLAIRMKVPGGLIGGRRSARLIDRRTSRMVSEDRLEELLRGKNFYAKLLDLLDLDSVIVGEYGQRMIRDYLKRLLDNKDFQARLLDCSKGMRARLRSFADLQQRLAKSNLPPVDRNVYCRMLDEIQYTYIRTTGIFSKIARQKKPETEEIVEAAGLAAEDCLTEDKSGTWARRLLCQHGRSPAFIRSYLDSLRDNPDRVRKLAAFNERMVGAGVFQRDLTKLRVLLADDEEAARGYVEMILRDLGVSDITIAADGREALEHFSGAESAYDLIVCDWKMPRLSGISFLKQVRSVHPEMPFLMVTALASLINVEEAMAHDVTAYIAKPFAPEQLEEKVLILINTR